LAGCQGDRRRSHFFRDFLAIHLKENGQLPSAQDSANLMSIGSPLRCSTFLPT
jgi:hypothetical protein